MGRKLRAVFVEAGFRDVEVTIIANPDADGRLLGMIRNMAKYARQGGEFEHQETDQIVAQLEQAQSDGTYLVVSPQFVVTGRKAA